MPEGKCMSTQFGYGARDFPGDGQGDKECGKRNGKKKKSTFGHRDKNGLHHVLFWLPGCRSPADGGHRRKTNQPVLFLKGGINGFCYLLSLEYFFILGILFEPVALLPCGVNRRISIDQHTLAIDKGMSSPFASFNREPGV